MISAKDITVVLPAVFPDRSHFWMMEASCKRFGIEPVIYGLGDIYAGWLDILFYRLWRAVDQVTTSHVLVSDARDAFFLTGMEEIAGVYTSLGCPDIFASAYDDQLAFGGFLAKTSALLEAFAWMHANMRQDEGDVVEPWGLFMKAHPTAVTLDTKSVIFLNVGHNGPESNYKVTGKEVFCPSTLTWPCHIHFNGGYSDPVVGKWPMMQSLWRELGYKESPPWYSDSKVNITL